MICLDLEDGTLCWERYQPDLAYIACIADSRCLLICRHRFIALQLSDGMPAWNESPFVAIPAGGMPGGRGLTDGQCYYLPTTDPELVQIEIQSGRVVRRVKLTQALGNLVPGGDYLLAQNAAGLTVVGDGESCGSVVAPLAETDELRDASADRLIGLLGHDRFSVREKATLAVLARGQELIAPLGTAARNRDSEVAYRATSTELEPAPTGGGFYRSWDGGQSWEQRYTCYCRAAWVDPDDPQHLILGRAETVDRGGRIEESRDGGQS